jgi:hypothetical protein
MVDKIFAKKSKSQEKIYKIHVHTPRQPQNPEEG